MRNPDVGTSSAAAARMVALLGPRHRVADFGAGDGRLLFQYRQAHPEVGTGVAYEVDRTRRRKRIPGIRWSSKDVLALRDKPTFDGILSNPPYLRTSDMLQGDKAIYRSHFHSAHGQFDAWFLFVEKASRLLLPGGRAVFLVPQGIQTRPAAKALREQVSRNCDWRIEATPYPAFERDVGIAAEFLVLDRMPEATAPRLSTTVVDDLPIRVGVGAATGANAVYIRAAGDPWLDVVEKQFQCPVGSGRASERGGVAIWPYLHSEAGAPELASLDAHPGLERFVAAHARELEARSRPAHHGYIQCPRWAYEGRRLAIADIHREPKLRWVADGSLILNDSFCISGPNRTLQRLLDRVRTDEWAASVIASSGRLLTPPYRRLSVTGLTNALRELASEAT